MSQEKAEPLLCLRERQLLIILLVLSTLVLIKGTGVRKGFLRKPDSFYMVKGKQTWAVGRGPQVTGAGLLWSLETVWAPPIILPPPWKGQTLWKTKLGCEKCK